MKRFFRNLIIIAVFELAAFALASLDAITLNWKLLIMFIGGFSAGAVIAFFDQRVLRKKIEILQRIREGLNIKSLNIKD